MKLKLFSVIVLTVILMGSGVYAQEAVKTSSPVIFNDGGELHLPGYNIDETNYFMLRDIANLFNKDDKQFNIGYNENTKEIEIIRGEAYSYHKESIDYPQKAEATVSNDVLIIDGKRVDDIKAYKIDGHNYYKLRDLGKYIPFAVDWVQKNNSIYIYSTAGGDKNIYVPNGINYLVDYEPIGSRNFMTPYRARPSCSEPYKSSLYDNKNGTFTAVYLIDAEHVGVTVHNSKTLECVSSRTIPVELSIYGGFYSGSEYNYLVFGDNNKEENDNKEVIRIVKYDKNFNRISSCSMYGGYTITPFEAGTVSMSENGNELIVHTSRVRYLTEDGLNHQSNLTLIINSDIMQITNTADAFQPEHVSHSFNQLVKHDNGNRVLVDHGDGYPRAILLQKFNGKYYEKFGLHDMKGKIGDNYTGVSLGGFEISDNNYIVAMSSIDLNTEDISIESIYNIRNIVLLIANRNNISYDNISKVQLTYYNGIQYYASKPYIVKLPENKFMVMWHMCELVELGAQYKNKNHGLRYVIVDENGNMLTDIKTDMDMNLSMDCQPIYIDGRVIWYNNLTTGKVFNVITP